jgi:hypothetical protein
MSIQKRNDEQVNLLEADFVRRKLPIFVYGNAGGFAEFELQGITNPQSVLIPDGVYDVKSLLTYRAITKDEVSGTTQANAGSVAPGANADVFSSGGSVCNLRVTAAGIVEILRTGGSNTFTCRLRLDWI